MAEEVLRREVLDTLKGKLYIERIRGNVFNLWRVRLADSKWYFPSIGCVGWLLHYLDEGHRLWSYPERPPSYGSTILDLYEYVKENEYDLIRRRYGLLRKVKRFMKKQGVDDELSIRERRSDNIHLALNIVTTDADYLEGLSIGIYVYGEDEYVVRFVFGNFASRRYSHVLKVILGDLVNIIEPHYLLRMESYVVCFRKVEGRWAVFELVKSVIERIKTEYLLMQLGGVAYENSG